MTDEIDRIHDYLAGEATDDQRRRLEAWLKDDVAHVDLFAREAFLHRALGEALRERAADMVPPDNGQQPATGASARTIISATGFAQANDHPLIGADPAPGSSVFFVWASTARHWMIPILGIVLAAAVGAWLVGDRARQRVPAPRGELAAVTTAGTDQSVAYIEESSECVWGDPLGHGTAPGPRVSPGNILELSGGTANVCFDCGATVTLKGPAVLEIDTPTDATLIRGDVSVNVPEEARGFLVHTCEMDVRDLGTEFKLNVDEKDQTTVEVVEGEVETELARPQLAPVAKRSLRVGEFLRTGVKSAGGLSSTQRLSLFRGVRVDFGNPRSLNLLTIANENPDHYRYDAKRGCLSIDTTWGNVFGRNKEQPGENLFLLPVPQTSDFDVVLSVAGFRPQRPNEHVGVLAMNDYDNYARIIYAMHRIEQGRYVQFNVEEQGRNPSRVAKMVELGPGPFQLRLSRRGNEISGWWSPDGRHWELRDRGKTPAAIRYVGFYASKGHPFPKDGTPYQQALIDQFEIEIQENQGDQSAVP